MINTVVLVGRLTRDPELRRTTSGNSVVSFTIAVDDLRKDPNGEKAVIFMPVTVFGQVADNCVKFIRKGSLVGVTGRLTQRKYTRKSDNVEITSTEITATGVEFLSPKDSGEGATTQEFTPDAPATDVVPDAEPVSEESDAVDATQDDLPF